MISIAIFVFSELKQAHGISKDAHEVQSAHFYGVMKIAYTTNYLTHGLS